MLTTHPKDHPHYDAVYTIAQAVLASEKSIDDALIQAAELVSVTLRTAEAESFPRQMAQPVMDKIGAAFASLIASRKDMVAAHTDFGRIAHGLGANVESWGDSWPCPQASARRQRPTLKNVA
jgi:hypothetical protein